MIRLTKAAPPAVLTSNKERWTIEFFAFQRGDDGIAAEAARRYAHQDIRDALRDETSGKCAYCEAHIEHVDYSHIEHILPKSRRPEMVCEWENLTLACSRCNVNKGDYYDLVCMLVDPYQDEIGSHLVFAGPLVAHRSPDRGRVTISKIGLNRSELMAKRKEAIENVQRVLDLLDVADEGPVKQALEGELAELTCPQAEFSATTRAFVRARGN
jgi:uncharacterized protein (TIGR02646 family)